MAVFLRFFLHAALFAVLAALGGCADIGEPYSQIDPAAAQADVRRSNGYYALKQPRPDAAKLVVRSEGSLAVVRFAANGRNVECAAFEDLGAVKYAGEGEIPPWIAQKTRETPYGTTPGYLERLLAPGRPVVVASRGYQPSSDGISRGSALCTPAMTRFVPRANRTYLVRYLWNDGRQCRQEVLDATDPDAPVLLPVQMIGACDR